ncbi:MAG TPA: hemerythrin family protein [Anaeromyxobacteraceae bacterium]|nr:hemerythrin family protein [Anaeromyxobacteraceae bacterium]
MSKGKADDIQVGVQELDSEHDLMLGLVRALEKASASAPRTQVEALLQQLSEFSRVHFATEEIMMRLYAYPDFARHQLEHARLVEQIEQVRTEFAAGRVQPSTALAGALRHWFGEHVRTHDLALARFVRDTGSMAS